MSNSHKELLLRLDIPAKGWWYLGYPLTGADIAEEKWRWHHDDGMMGDGGVIIQTAIFRPQHCNISHRIHNI